MNGKFGMGSIVATPGALSALEGDSVTSYLDRHRNGDWGIVCPEDAASNEEDLKNGERLLSAYTTAKGVKIWIITEHDRSVTTILLPEEY